MEINSINGINTQMRQMGMNQATDSYSRNIQNQIANAQKQMQELSSNENMILNTIKSNIPSTILCAHAPSCACFKAWRSNIRRCATK